jgi:hypothetical protein
MPYFQLSLTFGSLEALECCTHELSYEFLHDQHNGQATNEQTYIYKLSKSATSGELWADFTVVYWISRYLEHPIHVWNFKNG